MERQMVQCEDGRRRQARIHGLPKEEGGFRIWKAGVRLKGKHVSGEAWYSFQTKTWYFLSDPEGKHSHLIDRIGDTVRGEKISKLRDQLKQLESRQLVEQKTIDQHRKALEEIDSEIETLKNNLAALEKREPPQSSTSLHYSRGVKTR